MKKSYVALLFLPLLAFADMFSTEPGTRAQGMGGAFTAIADTAEAGYYNPAGTSRLQKQDIREAYFGPTFMTHKLDGSKYMTGKLYTPNNRTFLTNVSANVGQISKTVGLSYVEVEMTMPTSTGKFITEEVGFYGLSRAFSERFSMGLSIYGQAAVKTLASFSIFSAEDTDYVTDLSMVTGGLNLGAKYKLYSSNRLSIDLGFAQRVSYGANTVTLDYTEIALTGIPSKTSLGISATFLRGIGLITVAAKSSSLDYTETTNGLYQDETDTNFGIEFANKNFMLRAGTSSQTVAKSSITQSIDTLSFGAGIVMGKDTLEFAMQNQNANWGEVISGTTETTESFSTFSITFNKRFK